MKLIVLLVSSLFILNQFCLAQQAGDVLQIGSKTYNARTSIFFKGKKNVAFTLTPQDISEIVDVRVLPSGNKALRINVVSGPNAGKKAWIYYNVNEPDFEVFTSTMESFDLDQEEAGPTSPEVTRKETPTPVASISKEPIKVEEERIQASQDEAAVNTSEELEEYDKYFLEMVSKYESEIEKKGSQSLMDQAQNAIANLANGPSTPDTAECADCKDFVGQSPLNEMIFETCNSSNNDLEPNFAKAFNSSMAAMKNEVNTQEFDTALKCIYGGMQGTMGGTGGFYNCPSPKSFLKEATRKKSTRPCLSKSMVGSTASEIYLASKCFEQDIKRVLPLLRHESRFIPNVRSVTGAGGVGQLTGVAIKEINRNLDRYIQRYSSKPGCEYLKDVPEMHTGFICSRMHIPTNPRQNVVFSIIYQRLLRDNRSLNPKKSVDRWLSRRSSSISERDKVQVEEMLLRTSYNSGPGAVLTAFNTFAASPSYRNLPTDQFLDQFYSYLRRNVRSEAANYNGKVLKDLQVMEKNAGIKCSI